MRRSAKPYSSRGAALAVAPRGSARRWVATTLIVLGLLTLAWTVVVWRWQDPVTGLEAWHRQGQLAHELRARTAAAGPSFASEARLYRRASSEGEAMGRIAIPRIGLHAVLVEGTSETDLAEGPGIYAGDYLPGEGRLVYIAGHRTIYGAPFSHLERLRPGDAISISMPYGTFVYVVTGHRVVDAHDVAVLRSHAREQLILQTCHPRFSATHRLLVYAKPSRRTAALERQ